MLNPNYIVWTSDNTWRPMTPEERLLQGLKGHGAKGTDEQLLNAADLGRRLLSNPPSNE